MTQTIGTCGNCGGAVQVPTAWMGVNPPVPRCASCGSAPKASHGPVIDMQPRGGPAGWNSAYTIGMGGA